MQSSGQSKKGCFSNRCNVASVEEVSCSVSSASGKIVLCHVTHHFAYCIGYSEDVHAAQPPLAAAPPLPNEMKLWLTPPLHTVSLALTCDRVLGWSSW